MLCQDAWATACVEAVRFRFLAVLFAIATICVAGCSRGEVSGRYAIDGKVTLDGVPLAQGSIRFEPQDSSVGTSAAAVVTDGAYSIPASKGLAPGTYRVFLTATDTGDENRTADEIMNHPEPSHQEIIPAKYNRQSELTVEVKADAASQFDFALESKGGGAR